MWIFHNTDDSEIGNYIKGNTDSNKYHQEGYKERGKIFTSTLDTIVTGIMEKEEEEWLP